MLSSLRVEHAILDTESGRNAAFSSVSEQPRRANLRGTRGLLTTTRGDERALSIDQFGDLSIYHRRPQLPATSLLEWSQSPIRILTLICGAVPICID
jgi:hypothetical protein